MRMNFKGIIKVTKNRLFVNKQECLGVTKVHRNQFSIKISEQPNKDIVDFMETLLHEMIHLYFFILMNIANKRFADYKQHNVIEASVPFILNKIALEFDSKRIFNVKNSNKKL